MRSTMTAYGHASFMRVPPSLAYSAMTPVLLRLTSSIKAGGHDHSRPTMTPILSICPPPGESSLCGNCLTLDFLLHYLSHARQDTNGSSAATTASHAPS